MTENTTALPESPPTEVPFYGITSSGSFVRLPPAEYPYRAIERFREQPDFEELALTLYPLQLAVIRSSVEAHLSLPENERPSFLAIRVSDLQLVYASPEVVTRDQAESLVNPEEPDYLIGPFLLSDIHDHWLAAV